jgi:uncharacterized integral membrane protein (TIGR00698 family)
VTKARQLLPGLALVSALTALAYLAATIPTLSVIGPLVLALVVGLVWRATLGLPARAAAGARFAGKTILKIGIVLLGIRLDFLLLVEVGPVVLLGNVLVVCGGLVFVEWLGRKMGLDRGLRLAIAVGTSICGASAIVAAVPIIRATDEDAGVSVTVISLLGTVAVLGYVLLAAVVDVPIPVYGILVGATLQEVAQVVAAGYTASNESGDLALLVKLARVALLAPALIVLNLILRRQLKQEEEDRNESATESAGDPDTTSLPPLVPWFLTGFLVMGALNSLGVIPGALAGPVHRASLMLTAAAMAGIGLMVDFSAFRYVGRRAVLLGAAGFGLLVAMMVPYVLLVI